MEKAITQFRGIERNTDIELSKDGGMLDLINLRLREDGGLEPMGQPTISANLGEGVIPLYIHYLPSGDANLICAIVSEGTKDRKYDDDKTYDIVWGHRRSYVSGQDKFFNISEKIIIQTDVSSFPRLYGSGNILCVDNDDECQYYLFKGGKYVKQFIPDPPSVTISQALIREEQEIDNTREFIDSIKDGLSDFEKAIVGSQIWQSIIANYNNLYFPEGDLSDYLGFIKTIIQTKTGTVYERILIMAAVRLFDGAYLAPSNIAEIGFSSLRDSCVRMRLEKDKDGKNRRLVYSIPLTYFSINAGIGGVENIPRESLSLIESLDVFAFKYDPYSQPKLTERATGKEGEITILHPCLKIKANRMGEGILDEAHGFYLIGSARYKDGFQFQLKSHNKADLYKNSIEDVNPLFYNIDRFVQEPSFDWNKVIPIKHLHGDRYFFGGRTHLYNIKETPKVSEVFQLSRIISELLYHSRHSELYYKHSYFTIILEDEFGDHIKVGTATSASHYLPYIYTCIPWARKIILEVRYNGDIQHVFDIPLHKHKYMPIYYADCRKDDDWDFSSVESIIQENLSHVAYPWKEGLYKQHELQLNKYKTPKCLFHKSRNNLLRVSSVDNPIGFLSKTTYSFSGDIIGVSSLHRSPEEWHFSPYPLYVFTSKGVNALKQGDSDIAYSNTLYVSEDVLAKSGALTSTPIGVVYATRNGEIRVLRQESVVLSYHLNGYYPKVNEDKAISSIYDRFTSQLGEDEGIYNETLTTEKFIRDCSLYYSQKNGEIVLYNKDFNSALYKEEEGTVEDDPNGTIFTRTSIPYCYVYNIGSKSWSKRTIPSCVWKTYEWGNNIKFQNACICNILNAHDKIFIAYSTQKDGFIFDWDSQYYSACNVLMITRPICFDTNDLVKVEQVALRALMKPLHRAVVFPNDVDGKDLKLITYKNKIVESIAGLEFYVLASQDGIIWKPISGKVNISELRDVVIGLNRSHAYRFYSFALVGLVRSDTKINYLESIISRVFNNRLR